jgi:hypothetical protein
MFSYASSALPGVVQQLTVCQSRGTAYVFPRAQSNVLFMLFMFSRFTREKDSWYSFLLEA